MTNEEILLLTRIVRAAFPAQRFDEFTIDVWADSLRDQSFAECRAAVTRLVAKQTFASVAEIIAEARNHRRNGMQAVHSRRVLGEIESAKRAHDPNVSHAGYLEASRALADALAAIENERGTVPAHSRRSA